MITLEDGAKRHEKLFPIADLQSQIYKLEEELKEVAESATKEQATKELADCIIVAWGIYRFCPEVADNIVLLIMHKTNSRALRWDEVLEQAEKKWLINEGRTWKFDGKVYKHVGKDGIMKKCPVCGKEFEPNADKQIFCSEACKTEMAKAESKYKRLVKHLVKDMNFELKNEEKILRAKKLCFGTDLRRCPCDAFNPKRYCGSPLCIHDTVHYGHCHCHMFWSKDKPLCEEEK